MLSAADEMGYEEAYRESDPLNLDGSAMVDDSPTAQLYRDMEAEHAFFAEYDRRATFYRNAAETTVKWKKDIFPGGYEAVVVKIDLANKLLPAGFYEAAEFALKDAIETYDYLEERINDWASD